MPAEYERPTFAAAAGAGQRQFRPFGVYRCGQLAEKEPHQNRRWGSRRDRRAGSAPVYIKERAGRS